MTTQHASFMRRTVTVLLTITFLVGILAVAALPAGAKVRGPNGRIVFGRFDPAVGDFHIFTVKPDGTDKVQLLPGIAECPRWSPDGEKIQVCVTNPKGLGRPATLNPDGSGFRLLDNPDPTLNLPCWAWSSRCSSPHSSQTACHSDGYELRRAREASCSVIGTSPGRICWREACFWRWPRQPLLWRSPAG